MIHYDTWKLTPPDDDAVVRCPACGAKPIYSDAQCDLCGGNGEVDTFAAKQWQEDTYG